jgi:hypothetical protein
MSFQEELDRFWMNLVGPDEQLRRNIMAALTVVKPQWRTVKVHANGKVRIRFQDKSTKTIRPPR